MRDALMNSGNGSPDIHADEEAGFVIISVPVFLKWQIEFGTCLSCFCRDYDFKCAPLINYAVHENAPAHVLDYFL